MRPVKSEKRGSGKREALLVGASLLAVLGMALYG